MSRQRIAIIGAGIAGLATARRLADIADVTVIEKSRGVGGRMATRRGVSGQFDHGAQYFTIRDSRFHGAVEPLLDSGTLQVWNVPLMQTDADGTSSPLTDRAPRFVAVPTMTALPKAMAKRLDLRTGQRVLALHQRADDWHLSIENGSLGPFDWVVSSAPAPQTLDLLPWSPDDRASIAAVRMNGCFTLMIRLADGCSPPVEAARVDHPVISWIADNAGKPERDADPCIVVHADNQWSDAHLEQQPEIVKERMLSALRSLFPQMDLENAVSIDLHRWRFANVAEPLGRPFIVDPERRIAACGDWCIGNRVEAAFMSGLSLGDQLRAHLTGETA